MALVVKEAYHPGQNILVYTGKITGKITDKNKVFLGKLRDLPQLKPGKRYNIRVRGSDEQGNRLVPLQCKARTDGKGTLLIDNKFAPVVDATRDEEMENPHDPLPPRPTIIAWAVNRLMNGGNLH